MSFALAPMDRLIWALTLLMAPVPVVMLLMSPGRSLFAPALFIALIYAYILLWLRPIRFELGRARLTVVWPLRRAQIELASLSSVRFFHDKRALQNHLGWAMRIGAGGPWGGFGLLKTQHKGMMRFYISRISDYVMLVPKSGKPWLITPADHARLLRELEARGVEVHSPSARR